MSKNQQSIEPSMMLAAIDSDDYYHILLEACKISPETYNLVTSKYSDLFDFDKLKSKYENYLEDQKIKELILCGCDDTLEKYDPDDDISVTGLTVGQAYVRNNVYHIIHNLSRLLVADAYFPILYISGLLLQRILHPRWNKFPYELRDLTEEILLMDTLPPPASQISPLVEWVEEILDICDNAVGNIPSSNEKIDSRVHEVWQKLRLLATRYLNKTEQSSTVLTSNNNMNPLTYPIEEGSNWSEDICENIIHIDQILTEKYNSQVTSEAKNTFTSTDMATSENVSETSSNISSSSTKEKHGLQDTNTPIATKRTKTEENI